MIRSSKYLFLAPWRLIIFFFFFLASCATVPLEQTGDYSKPIAAAEAKLRTNPNDFEALRDLGIIYFQSKQYPLAKDYLKRARALDAKDAKTLFFYGMTLESQNDRQGALAAYINYTDFSALSQYRTLMEGRYRSLTRDVIQQQLQALLVQEDKLGDKDMSPTTLAVFSLAYQGKDEKYSSLGTGLSEMMIIDLGQIAKLRLVERIRIDALLAELRFGQTGKVDPATAPRLGKLLAAGRIVAGAYSVSDEKVVRMDVSSWDVVKKKFPEPAGESDALDNLFKVQKDLVFTVLKNMGITPTKSEREKIQRIPTKNLQAFLLYSIGLEKESARDYGAASVYFNQAVSLDPDFAPAKSKAGELEALSLAGGNKEKALAAAYRIEPPVAPGRNYAAGLVAKRLQHLGNSIGSSFYPGQDSRKAAEEAAIAGAAIGNLPDPPPPPVGP